MKISVVLKHVLAPAFVSLSCALAAPTLLAQIPVTNPGLSAQAGDEGVNDYSVTVPGSTSTYNFATGAGNEDNVILDTFELPLPGLAGVDFERITSADRIILNRVDNTFTTGTAQTTFYEQSTIFAGPPDPAIGLAPDRAFSIEEAISGTTINRGGYNLFNNVPSPSLEPINNVERVDFIYSPGLRANNADQQNFGFLITDAGGDTPVGVAAITGLNPDGSVASYADTFAFVDATAGDYGALDAITARIFDSLLPGGTEDEPLPRIDTVDTLLSGSYVSLAQLGIPVDQTIYGYSTFAFDTALAVFGTSTADLLDVTNPTFFPTTTTGSAGYSPFADMVAGAQGVSTENFVQPEAEVSMSLVLMLVLLNSRRLYRRLSGSVQA